jgi:hypothetical protein
MKITYAKFFQPVQVVKDKSGATDMATYVRQQDYNIVLDGQFIKVQPKNGGQVTYVTVFNTCFLRTENEDIDASAETSGKTAAKTKTKQD